MKERQIDCSEASTVQHGTRQTGNLSSEDANVRSLGWPATDDGMSGTRTFKQLDNNMSAHDDRLETSFEPFVSARHRLVPRP